MVPSMSDCPLTITQTSGPVNGGDFADGTTVVTYTADDGNGHTATCSFTVTVDGTTELTVANCPADISVTCGDEVTWTAPTASVTGGCGSCSSETAISGFIYLGDFEGHRYYCSSTSNFTFDQADAAATAAGGYLLSVNSAGENSYISGSILASYVWIGYTDEAVEGNFEWTSGEANGYENWKSGEPNNGGNSDYTVLRRSNSQWYDRQGSDKYEFVMEVPCNLSITQTAGPSIGDAFAAGDNVVTYTATDGANTATCSFTVTNADDCEVEYCDLTGDNSCYEWIKKVSFGSIYNYSGNDGGYGDYTALSTDICQGASEAITLYPGFASSTYDEYWTVWIDWNHDGDFDDAGETVFQDHGYSSVSGNINVPAMAQLGETRMRIAMVYGCYSYGSCGSFGYGEVEDYTVNVIMGASDKGAATEAEADVEPTAPVATALMVSKLYPNPAVDNVNLELISPASGNAAVLVIDITGKVLLTNSYDIEMGTNTFRMNVSDLSSGNYFMEVRVNGEIVRERFVVK